MDQSLYSNDFLLKELILNSHVVKVMRGFGDLIIGNIDCGCVAYCNEHGALGFKFETEIAQSGRSLCVRLVVRTWCVILCVCVCMCVYSQNAIL